MSNLMSERKARRVLARLRRDEAFLAQHGQVTRTTENRMIDARAALAAHLAEAESLLKEQHHGPRTGSNYVHPHPAEASRPATEVGGC